MGHTVSSKIADYNKRVLWFNDIYTYIFIDAEKQGLEIYTQIFENLF